jgi:hypothetical protein
VKEDVGSYHCFIYFEDTTDVSSEARIAVKARYALDDTVKEKLLKLFHLSKITGDKDIRKAVLCMLLELDTEKVKLQKFQ